MKIVVKEVSNPKEFKIFYQFQNKLYANCKEYVPTLDMDQKNTLRNDPALDYCKRVMLLAYKGDRVVGRIMGMINPRYNDFYRSCVLPRNRPSRRHNIYDEVQGISQRGRIMKIVFMGTPDFSARLYR